MRTRLRLDDLRRASLAAFVALAMSACGGGDGDTVPAGSNVDVVGGGTTGDVTGGSNAVTDPTAVTTTLSSAAIDADMQALQALTPVARESQARTSSAQVERELLTISGVEAEMGGAAATDAAYANVAAQFVADPAGMGVSVAKRNVSQSGQVAKAAIAENAAGALFAGYMQVALITNALPELTGDLKPGQSKPWGGGDAAGVVTLDKVTLESSFAHTQNGLDSNLKTHFNLTVCPDSTGVFTGTATFEASMTKSGGATGEKSTLVVSIRGHVNDNADLAYYDIDTRMEMADFTNRKGAYVDFNLNTSIGNSPRANSGKVNRTGGQVTDAFANNAYAMGRMMSILIAIQMAQTAETAWKSGRCVSLDPTTTPPQRSGLQPSTAVAISAAPRSKIDAGPVGGSVTGTLSGEGTLAPSGTKVPADASFTYTAPSTPDKASKVGLEARSKRGVAKADVNFDTANDSWIGTASFSADDMQATAQITWVLVSSVNNVSTYKSTGPGTAAYNNGSCSYPTANTDTNGAGLLFVDFNTTPPTFHGAGTTGIVTVTITCRFSDRVETYSQPVALPVFGGTKGSEGVEAAGSAVVTQDAPMKIEGTDIDGVGGTFRWSFRRGR